MKKILCALLIIVSCTGYGCSHRNMLGEGIVSFESSQSEQVVEPEYSGWESTVKPLRFGYSSPVIEENGTTYFISERGIESVSEKQTKLLLEHPDVTGLYSNNHTLYYSIDNRIIYAISLKTNENSCIWNYDMIDDSNQTINSISDFAVWDDVLYILDTLMVRSYDLKTEQNRVLSDDVDSFAVCGSMLYWIDHAAKTFSIYQQDLSTEEHTLARGKGEWVGLDLSEKMYDTVITIQDSLYYTTRGTASLMTLNENGDDLLIDPCDNQDLDELDLLYLSANKEKLYYAGVGSTKDNLFVYDTTTQEKKIIAHIDDFSPQLTFRVIGTTIFYYSDENELKFLSL